jgi:hypothetical protein
MTKSITRALVAGIALSASSFSLAADSPTFKKFKLSDKFYSEGCTYGDFNKDGTLDYAAGPFWYEGPDFSKRHTMYEPKEYNNSDNGNEYSNNFLAFSDDFNNDGWADVLVIGFPGLDTSWFENPQGKDTPWTKHVALKSTDNESPRFGDVNNDGKRDLICSTGGLLGWAEQASDPNAEWTFHKIMSQPDQRFHKFTHGLGYGDVNSDGKIDLLEMRGWWEQPSTLSGDPDWKFHPAGFGGGGAQMYTYDVDGDGDADVITSHEAHKYGLAWYEQTKGADGDAAWTRHEILSTKPSEKLDGVQFSQPHALALVDMDGDGLKDIVTGKRRYAHGPTGDPDPKAAPVIYWFQLKRENGKVTYTPHLIDNDSGVGTQVTVTDMNADGKPDVLVGNKRGQFVLIQE